MSATFTTLPGEVRKEIYGLVFDFETVSITPIRRNARNFQLLNPLSQHTIDFHEICAPWRSLALLRVNREIYEDAAHYFYHKMIFRGPWPALESFIKGLGAYPRSLIRSVEITQTDFPYLVFEPNEAFKLLSGLPSLQRLRVAISVAEFSILVTPVEYPPSPQGLVDFSPSVEIRVFVPESEWEATAQNVWRNGKFGLVVRLPRPEPEDWSHRLIDVCDRILFGSHMVTDETADHATRQVAPKMLELHLDYEIPTSRPPESGKLSD